MHTLPVLMALFQINSTELTLAPQSTVLFTLDCVIGSLALVLMGWTFIRWSSGKQVAAPKHQGLPNVNGGAEAIVGPLLGYMAGYSLVAFIAGIMGDAMPTNSVAPLAAGAGAHAVGAIVCLWIAATQFDGGIKAFLFGSSRLARRGDWLRMTGVLMVALAACPVLLWLTHRLLSPFLPGLENDVHPTIELLRSGDAPGMMIVMLWLAAVVVAPVAEECFFRGILQNVLRTWYGHRGAAVAATSAAFAFVHAGQPATLPAIFLLSVLLGCLYERSGNLWSPILVHALFNARTMLWETLS